MVYPEHRDIAVLGVGTLDPERRRFRPPLERGARRRRAAPVRAGRRHAQGVAPACIDWAAFAAIAGDHSCSSRTCSTTCSDRLDPAGRRRLRAAQGRHLARRRRSRAGREAPARALVGDFQRLVENEARARRAPERAAHRGHPAAARRPAVRDPRRLEQRPFPAAPAEHRHDAARLRASSSLSPGSEINAIGVYAWFHLSALQKATRLANEQLAPAERQALARAMLADEAFALHFLEDTFAAGHVAGAWGDVSQRKGTHDYYNESGLEAFTWSGGSHSMVLMGDAHMRREDAERAAAAVRVSLEQLIDHATGRGRRGAAAAHAAARRPTRRVRRLQDQRLRAAATKACARRPRAFAQARRGLGPTPVPGLGPGLGSMPRFRAEVGPFVGFAGCRRPARHRRRLRAGDHVERLDRRRRSLGARRPRPRRRARRGRRRAGVRVARRARRLALVEQAAGVVAGARCRRRRRRRSRTASASRPVCGCPSIWSPATCC